MMERGGLKAEQALVGRVRVPGDKSMGHRALLLGALADGDVEVRGLSDGEDNRATAGILEALGVRLSERAGATVVHGVGLDGLQAPTGPLECGNSGTTMRLLLGILAGQPFQATLVGDASLSRRPMRRVLTPLTAMGLQVVAARDGGLAPLTVRGQRPLKRLDFESPVASAQVKSAILLANLWVPGGDSTVTEPYLSRDHTERMLAYMMEEGRIRARPLEVPGDLSSAAFVLAAALLVPGSQIAVENVGVNPTRTGFLDVIRMMGANIELHAEEERCGEPFAELRVAAGELRGVEVDGALAVRALDELPLVATLAARADGVTVIRDAAELRVKESDRIAKTVAMLRSFGVSAEECADGMRVVGQPDGWLQAGDVDADGDHRIAMCAALMSLAAEPGTVIRGAETIASSFPSFWSTLAELGASSVQTASALT